MDKKPRTPHSLRLPVDLQKWLKHQAVDNGHTDKHFNRMRPSIDPCKNPHSTCPRPEANVETRTAPAVRPKCAVHKRD
jgi:hypothetical protein